MNPKSAGNKAKNQPFLHLRILLKLRNWRHQMALEAGIKTMPKELFENLFQKQPYPQIPLLNSIAKKQFICHPSQRV